MAKRIKVRLTRRQADDKKRMGKKLLRFRMAYVAGESMEAPLL
jgi:hypothetical protein